MSLNNKKKTPTASDVFDDDFEVIYEGDLPDISIDDDDDDDYRDVLSGLSDIDHTDYIRKNDYDRLTKKLKDKNRKTSRKSRNQKGKDNFFDTSYYDEDFLDELDDELYDDDIAMDDDYDDSRNGRKKEKNRRKSRMISTILQPYHQRQLPTHPKVMKKCVVCGYRIWSFLWKMKAQKHKKRLKINLPK